VAFSSSASSRFFDAEYSFKRVGGAAAKCLTLFLTMVLTRPLSISLSNTWYIFDGAILASLRIAPFEVNLPILISAR